MILSDRQKQIVREMASTGDPHKLIAVRMGLTEGTVKEYLKRIYQKTGATNSKQLIIWAFHHAEELRQ